MFAALNAGSGPSDPEDVGPAGFEVRRHWKNFGEFKIDQAKFSEMGGVGDIARFGVIMFDPVFLFQFLKKCSRLFFRDEGGRGTAICGDESESFRIMSNQAGHIWGAPIFKCFQNSHFIFESFVGICPAELLVNMSLEVDSNE